MTIPHDHPIWCDPRGCRVVQDMDDCLVVEHRSVPMQFSPLVEPENHIAVGLLRRDEHGSCPGTGELRLVLTVSYGTEDEPVEQTLNSTTEAWLGFADARMFAAMVDREVEHGIAITRLSPRVTS